MYFTLASASMREWLRKLKTSNGRYEARQRNLKRPFTAFQLGETPDWNGCVAGNR